MTTAIAIASNRFGLGSTPALEPSGQPRSWLKDQLDNFDPRPPMLGGQPSRAEIAAEFREYQLDRREFRKEKKEAASAPMSDIDPERIEKVVNTLRLRYTSAAEARVESALATRTCFAERLVHFWSNHFAVSVDKLPVLGLAGDHEFTAIRPNIMGKFSNLLYAAVTHPAMLLYLDQAQSIGPSSPLAERVAARRNKDLGLNENLAREVLELHTLGVRSVYSQTDVTEFARSLTGFTVGGMAKGPVQRLLMKNGLAGETQFFPPIHEPGERQIAGRTYRQQGEAQAKAILADLAVHPATAKHIATKLARHFVADVPPDPLVDKLERAFLQSGGDLPVVYQTLVDAPEAWTSQQAKFKSPWEWVVSGLRALDIRELPNGSRQTVQMFNQLGQPIWRPGSPAGYADTTENWAGGAALMRRVEIASRMAQRSANRVDARTLAPLIMPGQLSQATTQSIARAESPSQGLALMLLSPEFLRR
jgi:uncharacterized protein (DUF1800 family)